VLAPAIQTVQYDLLNYFEPVVLLASNPQFVISRNSIPAKDLKGLIAWLKANPDKASAGMAGIGSVSHVAGVLFQRETGTQFHFVPYRGVNLAQQDLIAHRRREYIATPTPRSKCARNGRLPCCPAEIPCSAKKIPCSVV
jgi:tripartite-type tricarboxylate transporter receptor subunit TctC